MVPRLTGRRIRRETAFTLAEVLVVLALFGLIATLAFAPSVIMVRGLVEARDEGSAEQVTDYVLGRILAEMALSPADFPDGPAAVLIRRDLPGGAADDRLAFWSDWGGEAGVRAWMVFRGGPGRDGKPGLYRWVLPLASPEGVEWEGLDPAKGKLLGPGFDSLRFSVLPPRSGEWSDEYSGSRPAGVRIKIADGEEEFFYEDRLPSD
ncbi:MAG: PulJ/GspJ family protein [Aminivibrio sp.]|jgi:prepilin-type N-terminal cleavage/methylation domain-containing protein|nr:type II secretion system protein [Synergistaceae bacterium]